MTRSTRSHQGPRYPQAVQLLTEINDPTLVRDASNKQPHLIGKTRLLTASPAPHSTPPWSCFQTQASSPPSPSTPAPAPRPRPSTANPDPHLPKNVACNSPTAISTFETRTLKSCGFRRGHQRPLRGIACDFLSYPQISQTAHTKRHKVAQSIHGPQRRAT